MESQTFIQAQEEVVPLVQVGVINAQAVEGVERTANNGNGVPQSTLHVPLDSELQKLDEQQLKAATKDAYAKCERRTGKEMGPLVYWLRLRMRAQGSRNDIHEHRGFNVWVESNLDVSRTTANRWADDHAKELNASGLTLTENGRSSHVPKGKRFKHLKRSRGITFWVPEPLRDQYKQAVETFKEYFKTTDSGEAAVKGMVYAAKIIAARSRSGNHRRTTAKRG